MSLNNVNTNSKKGHRENSNLKQLFNKKNLMTVSPFIYNVPSISVSCIRLFILLMIQVVMLLITKSYNAFFVVFAAFGGALCAGIINFFIHKEPIYNMWSILIQGILVGMLLPETFNISFVFFISFFVLFFSRTMFFKSINSWINVTAICVVICWFIGSNYFPDFIITKELLLLKNPSAYLIQNGDFQIYNFDSTITQFLNNTIFRWFKINIPDGYISLLWDTHSVIPAFRFNLLTILSSIILFSDNTLGSTVPCLFITVYAVLVRLFAASIMGGNFNQGDVILALLTSGTLFISIFVIQWYGTNPITLTGKIIYAILTGALAFFVTGCGTSPIGMVYTVLVSNLFNLVIRFFEEYNNKLLLNKVIQKLQSGESK